MNKCSPIHSLIHNSVFSGWIGGIFKSLSFKPKNQMILPDDKDPSVSIFTQFRTEKRQQSVQQKIIVNTFFQIIWDEQNKRWINKDGEVDEKESFKPPPKMMELPAMQQNMPTQQPPSIPTIDQSNLMSSYGSPTTPNSPDINLNSDPTVAKVPNLQSNMFKMQRNKSMHLLSH